MTAAQTNSSPSATSNRTPRGPSAQATPSERNASRRPEIAPLDAISPTNTATPIPPVTVPGSDYYLHLAEKFLITSEPQKNDSQNAKHPHPVAGKLVLQSLIFQQDSGPPGSALTLIDTDRWLGILAAYQEEIGMQYPFLDIEQLKDDIQRRTEVIAMLILTIISFLVDSDLPKCIYLFLTDRENLAWRGIGIVMRLIVELNARNVDASNSQQSPSDSTRFDRMFWTIFTLDRRWSFGTGLPFSVHDSDIERHPTLIEDSMSSSYLKNMISYCRIAADVRRWLLESSSSSGSAFDSARDLLNFRVDQWQRNLPSGLHFGGIDDLFRPTQENRGNYRIRLTLHLRANQMRIIIHRRSAVRAGPNGFDASTIHTLAHVSHDTIRILYRLARETDIYGNQHKTFNHFLEGALSSLLLVLGSINDEAYRAKYMKDAFDALDLIEQLSARSPISQRLREKFHGIREAVNLFRQRNEKQAQAKLPSNESRVAEQSLIMSRQQPVRPASGSYNGMVSPDIMNRGLVRSSGGGAPEMPGMMDQRLAQRPAIMPLPPVDRGTREDQQDPSQYPAYSQPEELGPVLTPETYASSSTFPQIYSSVSEAPPNVSQAFAMPDATACTTGEFYPTYFPEVGHVVNFCDNNFIF
ncbi:putative transcriptional regulatory protein [Escovopsis weberi]|uniref:Putative transcriptional regulatory protein n=1 Tax=Escovopsis weberi TaxID=150374 RepID=A0A0M8MT12_ESCWE|nr:putative transcriptional regulatory protein [Escovopsis weberi]